MDRGPCIILSHIYTCDAQMLPMFTWSLRGLVAAADCRGLQRTCLSIKVTVNAVVGLDATCIIENIFQLQRRPMCLWHLIF